MSHLAKEWLLNNELSDASNVGWKAQVRQTIPRQVRWFSDSWLSYSYMACARDSSGGYFTLLNMAKRDICCQGISLLIILSVSVISWAETFPFEEARPLYVGARALGMGNAFTSIADDATAGFWNPAGLIQWQGVKIFGENKFYNREDYAFDPKGIGYSYRGNAFFWGNKIAMGASSGTPDFNYYSFAKQLNSYIAIGLSLKFQRKHPSNYYQFFGYNFSYDIAFLSRPVPNIQIGLLAQNLPQKRFINLLSIGFSYRLGDVILPIDVVLKNAAPEIHLGAEYNLKKRFYIRAGISDYHPTFGFGVKIFYFRLDYAWIREKGFNSHFVSAELSCI